MADIEDIKEATMKTFDHHVANLSQGEYKEALEEVISDLEARLECVKDELAEAGEEA